MIVTGFYIGVAVDTYNRFSPKKRMLQWLIVCQDILFWFIQAVIVFYVLFQINYGHVRFYIFIALLCGYAAYQAFFHSLYTAMLERIIKIFTYLYKVCTAILFSVVVKPVIFVLKLLGSFCMIVLLGCSKFVSFVIWIVCKPFIWFIRPLTQKIGKNRTFVRIARLVQKIKGYFHSVRK